MDEQVTVDLEQLAVALQDQSGGLRWWLDTDSGELRVTSDDVWGAGERDEDDDQDAHLIPVEPLPSRVWYSHMADFVATCSDPVAQEVLNRALEGKSAFRRFKDTLHQRCPSLVGDWHAYQDQRAEQVARGWLADHGIQPQ